MKDHEDFQPSYQSSSDTVDLRLWSKNAKRTRFVDRCSGLLQVETHFPRCIASVKTREEASNERGEKRVFALFDLFALPYRDLFRA